MLAAAAVIGRSFSFEVLEASTESNSLLESIEEAEKAGLVASDAESHQARFEFSHELIRQTVLSDLSAPRRQRLHSEVAGAIERLYGDRMEDRSSELAHHYSAAGNAPKAVEYLVRSGQQAAERYAHLEAIAFLKRAVAGLKELPDNEQRARQELKILKELGQSWWFLGSLMSAESRAVMERRFELCERLGDSRELFGALSFMMSTYLKRDGPKARRFAERELALAERVGDPMMLAHANAAMGHVLVLHGEFVAARKYLEKDPVVPRAARRPGTRLSWASWAVRPGLSALAWDLWFLGYPDRAAEQLTQALAAAEIESDPFWRSSCWFYALRAYVCLRHPQTLDLARSLVSLVKEQGPRLLTGVAHLFVLWAEVEQGLAVDAMHQIRVAKAETHQGKPTMSWAYLMMADICAKVRARTPFFANSWSVGLRNRSSERCHVLAGLYE
jgi:hypothetical protein